jgi:hypothetical protein
MLVVGLGGESSSEPLLAMDSVHRRVAGLRNILQGIRDLASRGCANLHSVTHERPVVWPSET